MQEEIWKRSSIIPKYEVSNLGRVRNYKRKNVLKPKRSYEYLSIQANVGYKKYTSFKIHRLVATEFVPNPENKPYVNHLDCDKHNNYASNLEWVTQAENVQHAFRTKVISRIFGENHPCSKLKEDDIRYIRSHYIKGDMVFGISGLARMFKINYTTMFSIIHNERWRHVK